MTNKYFSEHRYALSTTVHTVCPSQSLVTLQEHERLQHFQAGAFTLWSLILIPPLLKTLSTGAEEAGTESTCGATSSELGDALTVTVLT